MPLPSVLLPCGSSFVVTVAPLASVTGTVTHSPSTKASTKP
jgi:hypothetical protein